MLVQDQPGWRHRGPRLLQLLQQALGLARVTYLGLLHLILGFIRLRKQTNVNRP
jgi:hypothetical protein